MQPAYMPWIGYFSLIAQVDRFVFLDDVPMAQQRPNWQKENRILSDGQVRWLRLPTIRPDGPDTRLDRVRLRDTGWPQAHLELIRSAYGDTPGYATLAPRLEAVLASESSRSLADLNIAAIRCMMQEFGLDTPVVRSSEIRVPESAKARRILHLCHAVGARRYISPAGARSYCNEAEFLGEGIALSFQEYRPRPYPQGAAGFVSHLSALDLLMRAPAEAAEHLSPA